MSLAEKAQQIVGMTPSHTSAEREEIRANASKKATSAWFKLVLKHHKDIEAAFDAVKQTKDGASRAAAQEKLMTIVTGHSIAEEAIVYPFMKLDTSAMDAGHVYKEQSMAKMEFVALDQITDKMSKQYDEKLAEIQAAIMHHMIEEERDYFPELESKADGLENDKITQHYTMEFERYMPKTSIN